MHRSDSNAPHLDSDLLRSFLAVAQAGSVSGAAVQLLRTQSAISVQLQKLEETVGQRLFQRHGRGVTLTAQGEQLLPVARRVVDMLDQAVIGLRGAKPQGTIRLGFPEEYSDTLLPEILARFAQEQHGARIFLRCGSSTEFPSALAKGELDLALHTPEVAAATDMVIHLEAAVWAGSAFHEVENRKPLPVALFDKACWWRERCLNLLEQANIEYEVVCTSESVAGIRAALSAGIAIGVLPQSAVTDPVARLSKTHLPDLGEVPLVLSRSLDAPAGLSDSLASIISRTIQLRVG